MHSTREFFDEMASTYDQDLLAVGWDPVALIRRWPVVIGPGERLLDVGCGTGAVLELFAGADRVLAGMDLSPEMLRIARKKRRGLREARLEAASAAGPWPFEDQSFDTIVALAMLEFVPELDETLDELWRVLRPGGMALISVEDRTDWGGVERPETELRYGGFPLWRRTWDDVRMCIPPGLDIVRSERTPGYTVLEEGFTTAYWIIELRRNDWYPDDGSASDDASAPYDADDDDDLLED